MIPKYTAGLPFCASKEMTFDDTRWVAERRGLIFDFITEQLLHYSRKTEVAPRKCIISISPELANSVECHNPTEFASLILGTPIDFIINWSLKDNRLQLEIS